MTTRQVLRIAWLIAFVVAAAGRLLAAEPAPSWRDELKPLMQSGQYAAAEGVARAKLSEVEAAQGALSIEAAEVIDALVETLWRGGKASDPSTKLLAERSLAIREKVLGPDHLDVASSLNSLALVNKFAGDYVAARPLFERALAIREKALGPEHPTVARSLNNLAYTLMDLDDPVAARPLFTRAIAIQEKALGPESPELGGTVQNLAVLEFSEGNYPAARQLDERALRIQEAGLGPDHPDVAKVLQNLALCLSAMGDYAGARPLYERALAIKEKALGPEHPSVAVTLKNLADTVSVAGDVVEARPLLDRALAIQEKALGPDHPELALTLGGLANLLEQIGDDPAARRSLERALAIQEKAFGPDHTAVARALGSLAQLDYAHGNDAVARPLFERALAIEEKALGPAHIRVATTLGNLANLLTATGDPAAARPLLERALAIKEQVLEPDHPSLAFTLEGLASVLEDTGNYAAALPLVQRALAIRQKALGPAHPDVADSLLGLARVFALQDQRAAALDAALDAERITREHLRLTGRSLSERQALQYAAVRKSGLDLVLTLAARGLDPASRKRALDALVRSRAVVLDEMAARHHAVSGTTNPQVAALAAALSSSRTRLANLVVRGLGRDEPEVYRKLLDDAQAEKERDERALAAVSSSFAVELSRRRLGIDEVAASLPSGTALVGFTQYRNVDLAPAGPMKPSEGRAPALPFVASYLAFVLRSGEQAPQVVNLGAAATMDELVAAWRKEASVSGAEAAYNQTGGSLRKKLWDPLLPVLGDSGRVFAVPDGMLNLVSFAALPDDEGGYVIEHGPLVHYLSAERDLVPSGETRRGQGLLALGAPSFDATSTFASLRRLPPGTPPPAAKIDAPVLIAATTAYRGQHAACGDFASARFGPLPATGKETREIVKLWGEHGEGGEPAPVAVIDLRDVAASETALKRSAPGRLILHLATHGFFLGSECASVLESTRAVSGLTGATGATADAPPPPVTGENPLWLSGLALAGANHRAAAGPGEDDGILTAEEIASLDLSGVEWAVLSACDTGVGEIEAGEGVFGLRRSFQVAGARSLIMSLWSVDDEATRSWMNALYEGRLESHLDTAEAVRHAGLEVLNDRRKRNLSTHPFYWAGFVAAGDWH